MASHKLPCLCYLYRANPNQWVGPSPRSGKNFTMMLFIALTKMAMVCPWTAKPPQKKCQLLVSEFQVRTSGVFFFFSHFKMCCFWNFQFVWNVALLQFVTVPTPQPTTAGKIDNWTRPVGIRCVRLCKAEMQESFIDRLWILKRPESADVFETRRLLWVDFETPVMVNISNLGP